MVDVFGNNIISAFTNGVSVKSIFTYGEQVWPAISEYYVKWDRSEYSGYFSMNGNTYYYSSYYPSNYFSDFSKTIPASAFNPDSNHPGKFSYIETNAKNIGSSAFYNCINLQTLSMSQCKRIEYGAFMMWTGHSTSYYVLSNIYAPIVSYIGSYAFAHNGYSMYWSVNFPRCKYIGSSAFFNCDVEDIYIPCCSYIGSDAFYQADLSYVSLPECEYIGSRAFNNNRIKSTVYLPKCSYIGDGAFGNNNDIISVNLPECKYIGAGAFGGAGIIGPLNLPKCEYIGRMAFGIFGSYPQVYITSVNLPVCSYISEWAFINNSYLSSVSLPKCEYFTTAFQYCSRLSSISLPVCSRIDRSAFKGCTSLSEVTLEYSGVCVLQSTDAFAETLIASGTGSIYVPSSLVSAYQADSKWSNFSNRIYPIP